jgi:hypothetical protein
MLNATSIDYDTYIVDGGHGLDTAEADLNNVISHGSKGSRILFDDTDMKELRLLVNMYMTLGKIINISDSVGILHNSSHMLFLNNK